MHIGSIALDPEENAPERLETFAKRYHAGPEWDHSTGTSEVIIKTAAVFGAYHGNKMVHTPVRIQGKAPGSLWIRFDGFVKANRLMGGFPGRQLPRGDFDWIILPGGGL
jgi:protein SCO1/2